MITSVEFANDICRVLDVDISRIISINISMLPNQVVTVTIERGLDRIEGDEIVKAMKKYALVDKEDEG